MVSLLFSPCLFAVGVIIFRPLDDFPEIYPDSRSIDIRRLPSDPIMNPTFNIHVVLVFNYTRIHTLGMEISRNARFKQLSFETTSWFEVVSVHAGSRRFEFRWQYSIPWQCVFKHLRINKKTISMGSSP